MGAALLPLASACNFSAMIIFVHRYNAFFLLALLWAVVCVQADTASLSSLGNIESPLSLSIFLNTFAFVIDLLVMASSWPTYSGYPGSNFPTSGGES